MDVFNMLSGYARVRRVGSFEELAGARFGEGVNALCWEREVAGDFGEVVRALGDGEGIVELDEAGLRGLVVSAAGRVAIKAMLEDRRRLEGLGLAPVLNCIYGYPREEEPGAVPVDVYSFHADSATVEADTWLCTYFGPASEGLSNEEAQRQVDLPAVRAELLRQAGGADDEAFREWLRENCYDLHYAAASGARPFSFGVGNLWRIATEYPGCPVPPCIHRAPATVAGEARLLLIS